MHEVGKGIQAILATSRTLPLRPCEAKTAVQACVDSFTTASSGAAGELRLNLPAGARAVLRSAPLHGASAQDRSLLVGTIRSRRGWLTVPVEVETAPVSDACSELVVRPVGAVCLRSEAHRRLFECCSHALADFFRMEIEIAGLAAPPPRPARVKSLPNAEPIRGRV
ncbi:MAG: hypothetical protein M3357_01555 [Actinomycetota bacterium]|nr:hypothetical protein [Actinomycetota bacterium]